MAILSQSASEAGTPDLVAIVLAAGKGNRFDASGVKYKPVQQLADGTPMVYAVCHALLQHIHNVSVVCGPQEQAVRHALRELPVSILHCADADQGMSASLRYAVAQSPAKLGWLIALADMPFVKTDTVGQVAACLFRGARIVRPEFAGKPGHPVAFGSEFREELLALEGDQGARAVIQQHPDALTCVPVKDPGCLIDIDTQDQLRQHR